MINIPKILHDWRKQENAINACTICDHGFDVGYVRYCGFQAAITPGRTPTTEQARKTGGHCGPEATNLTFIGLTKEK